MSERRKQHRWRSYLGGQAVFNARCSTFDCLVKNVSEKGVKLVFDSPASLPSEFELSIPRKGEVRQVRVIWRHELEAGVSFVERNPASIISIEIARNIRKLEAERDTLRRRVAQLSEST